MLGRSLFWLQGLDHYVICSDHCLGDSDESENATLVLFAGGRSSIQLVMTSCKMICNSVTCPLSNIAR